MHFEAVAWHPDGHMLAASGNHNIWLFGGDDWHEIMHMEISDTGEATSIDWNSDGERLVGAVVHDEWSVVCPQAEIRIWDMPSGREAAVLFESLLDRPYSVAWRPDGAAVAGSVSDSTVRIWGGTTYELLLHIASPRPVLSMSWSSDGSRLAGIGDDHNSIYVWNATDGELLTTLHGSDDGWVNSPAWNPDDRSLAVNESNRITIWDTLTWDQRDVLRPTSPIGGIAWSPDGTQWAGAVWNRVIRIWNRSSDQPPTDLREADVIVSQIAWSPDGHQLASLGADIQIWDTLTGDLVYTIEVARIAAN